MTPYRPIKTIHKLATNRRILLLQGPIGRFFVQLSDWLNQQGCTVYKINFNGGDEWFYPNARDNTFTYTQSLDDFGDYLTAFVAQHGIDAVACFGDTRAYHRIAKSICAKNNVSFWAFEEGYFRPDWIVLEEHGVNAYSQLPRGGGVFCFTSGKSNAARYGVSKNPTQIPPRSIVCHAVLRGNEVAAKTLSILSTSSRYAN